MNEEKILELTDINQLSSLYLEQAPNLYLKPEIKFKHLGGSWEIIQFLCSWKRKNQKNSIILDNQLNIEKLNFQSELLLSAFFLSKEVIYKSDDIRIPLLSKFIFFVENMNSRTLEEYLENNRAREIKFLCLGGARNEYLRLFYNDKSFKSKKNVEDLIVNIFKSPHSPIKSEKFPIERLNGIKEIIYEAFHNANEHGSRDIEKEKILKSIRALDVNFVDFNENNKKSFINHHKHYEHFLITVKQLLVISIFDNGEGIVKKYIETTSDRKENDMTFLEKGETIKKIFLPGISSSKIPNSGMGLTYIKNCVKELHGILSISTSTLEYSLTPGGEKLIEVAHRAGTLITVLIPIKNIK